MPTIRTRIAAPARVAALALTALAPLARADVTRVNIHERVDVLDARPFGDAGPYEKITGAIHFAWDPDDPANARIADIDLAPTNDEGLVEAAASFMVLQPKDPDKRSGIGLLEISNRGGKAALGYFNRCLHDRDPTDEADFGDGFLMELGLTVIWVGWQWDVPPRTDQLRIEAPIAETGEQTIENPTAGTIYGLARADWAPGAQTRVLPLAHRGHLPYTVARPGHEANQLTVREGREAPREAIPRDEWSFAKPGPDGVVPAPDTVFYDKGFEPGKVYELVYHTKNPRVVGVGLAAVRDTISYAKHDPESAFPIDKGIAFGVSQSGRFLRHYLYQGFNADEQGRIAFDGMFIHAAGAGRGSFNHRFAQPSRDGHRYSAFFYPTDLFPFTSRETTDPLTGETDGLLAGVAPEHRPKIFYTNTGYEYWGRAGSLVHTTPDAGADVEPLPNERVYHLASGQHYVSPRLPTGRPIANRVRAWIGNTLDFLLVNRALLTHLVAWVEQGAEPPPSRVPRIADATLVPIDELRFPDIHGVTPPDRAHVAYRVDYGPRWEEGIIDYQPPKVGQAYPVLVPQVDEFGNELGGVPTVPILVPIVTYTPWARRYPMPKPDELRDFVGMMSPLPRIAEGEDRRDSRPPVEVLYADREDFLAQSRDAAERLVEDGFLLERDIETVLLQAGATWDWAVER